MTMTNEKTVVERWVEALRSGRYLQTQKYLHAGNAFCCLGVLCDLEGDADWQDSGSRKDGEVVYQTGDLDGMPPGEVLQWANLSENAAERLANMNDAGDTFEQIADYIVEMYAEGENEPDYEQAKGGV